MANRNHSKLSPSMLYYRAWLKRHAPNSLVLAELFPQHTQRGISQQQLAQTMLAAHRF